MMLASSKRIKSGMSSLASMMFSRSSASVGGTVYLMRTPVFSNSCCMTGASSGGIFLFGSGMNISNSIGSSSVPSSPEAVLLVLPEEEPDSAAVLQAQHRSARASMAEINLMAFFMFGTSF